MHPATKIRPFLEVRNFRFRLWPILLAALAMESILGLGQGSAKWLYKNGPDIWDGHVSIYLLLAIFFQALLGLAGIAVMRRALPAADDHLRWPPDRSYVGLACAIGLGMGLTMLVADYWPDLLGRTPPQTRYGGAPIDIAGFLLGMLTTGLAEETIFRGFLVGMLAFLVPGRLRIGRLDLPVAAYIVAFLFAVAHWKSFVVNPFHQALAQQSYAFVWGLVYVWLMERSRSLLAPIVAHGVGNFTEVSLVVFLVAQWS